jgi:hypothetical protein
MGRVDAIGFARMVPDSDIARKLEIQPLKAGRYFAHNRKPKRGRRRLTMRACWDGLAFFYRGGFLSRTGSTTRKARRSISL